LAAQSAVVLSKPPQIDRTIQDLSVRRVSCAILSNDSVAFGHFRRANPIEKCGSAAEGIPLGERNALTLLVFR
jgi:hypothetical protein